MQRPSPGNRYTAEELELDANRIHEHLAKVLTIVEQMRTRERPIADIGVMKDAAAHRALTNVKTWARSVEDGFDAEGSPVAKKQAGGGPLKRRSQGKEHR